VTVYHRRGDGVEGEVLVAFFRELSRPKTVVGSGRHREQRVKMRGTPASCFITKQVRSLEHKRR
jgi:hypothetical protein